MTSAARTFAVVGAGLAGAATAWRLASAGEDVVLIEAHQPATVLGSSHGSARIFRHAYPDGFHARLTMRALDGWSELEDAGGVDLLRVTGGLDFGARRDLAGIARSLADLGIEHEVVDRDDAAERWSHIAFDGPAVYHPGAGVVDADLAVRTMVALAVAAGARVLTESPVRAITKSSTGYRVSGTAFELDAAVVVVCAGAWLPELLGDLPLPDGVRQRFPQLTVSQQQAFHFPFPAGVTEWPVYVHKDELSVYCLPGGRDAGGAGFKIAEHDGGGVTTASTRDGIVDDTARARVIRYVERYLPSVTPEPYAELTCLYTSTPSERFIIDEFDGLVIASPCSGHGAKFAPLLGELIAGAATGTPAPAPFRLAAHA